MKSCYYSEVSSGGLILVLGSYGFGWHSYVSNAYRMTQYERISIL
jgi:hypothetical protein